MTESEQNEIQRKIDSLPSGGISYKTINGKKYPYYQWREDGKQRGRRVKDEELESLTKAIAERKRLQKLLKDEPIKEKAQDKAFSSARTGEALKRFIAPVKSFKKRDIFPALHDYVFGNVSDRVFILYGLRRTGKTTMIRQVISEMTEEMFERTAFIQINSSNTLAGINRELRELEDLGYRYIFLDEVTLMEDFIEGAALFSDVYASSGMKIVLSGTDSLGFIFSEDDQLYDRCIMLHTTLIPYREFERVLGIEGIDEYIRYGGTMSMGGVNYNSAPTFATKASTDEYVDSAIARNIQHSLKYYRYGDHFGSLVELYEKNELTSAINRIIEDINHRFTLEVLTRQFKSHDLRVSANNLRSTNDVLDRIDTEAVTERLRELLEIRNREEQTVSISEVHRAQIKEYLDLLDLTYDIDVVHLPNVGSNEKHTVITQPGMRYSQATALIEQLMQDKVFNSLSAVERSEVTERILSEVKGRMLEDIVLLETTKAKKDCKVFKLQFAVGEFDMVVFDPKTITCEIYEIKHSSKKDDNQYRHLVDEAKCRETEFRLGRIIRKAVLYRGEDGFADTIEYLNVENYLRSLE